MDFVTESNGRDCKHGRLARKCEICEMEQEIEDLRARLSAAEADLQSARESRDHWMTEHGAEKERRQTAEAERDEAIRVAVWAVGRACELLRTGRGDFIVWQTALDGSQTLKYDGTDADLYRALRKAKEMSDASS